jgi:hypothetical protein
MVATLILLRRATSSANHAIDGVEGHNSLHATLKPQQELCHHGFVVAVAGRLTVRSSINAIVKANARALGRFLRRPGCR